MKLDNSLHDIRLAMFRYGGSFVQTLAQCFGQADPENREKLINAFPEIMERYDALATTHNSKQTETETP